jgi:hypothetical protein
VLPINPAAPVTNACIPPLPHRNNQVCSTSSGTDFPHRGSHDPEQRSRKRRQRYHDSKSQTMLGKRLSPRCAPKASPSAGSPDHPSLYRRERSTPLKNRTSGFDHHSDHPMYRQPSADRVYLAGRSGKAQIFTSARESSGESRIRMRPRLSVLGCVF